ncbi:MAG: methylcobamide--CoM methyltransferase [Candidatus Hadarchaeum sp.]|nr:methylcobamide--CoM methyltransferase [Candidatus Hadarchaeum sp.]
MELITASTGSYPRIGTAPEKQRLRAEYARLERGEISREDFARVQDEVTKEVIEEQRRAGIELVTDGQVRWYDQISHFARKLSGCEINGLLRLFDTNFYFRQPVINGKIQWTAPIVVDEFTFAKKVSPIPIKPVVTGPYTLAKHSIDRHYHNFSSLVADFAVAISREVNALAKAGAEIIQLDEPSILKNPQDFKIFESAVGEVNKNKGKARLALYTYFGDAAKLYDKLQSLPIDIIGLDFTYSQKLPNVIESSGSEKELGLGLIDGRNTKIENVKETAKVAAKILKRLNAERAYLNPSCGLDEYLPREVAFEKLKNLVAIAKQVRVEMR